MKLARFVITAAVVGLSGPAFAQGSGQPLATKPAVNQALANTPAPAAPQAAPTTSSTNPRSWMASGFIGANFGSSRSVDVDLSNIEDLNTNSSSGFNFGGQLAYVGRGVVGGEFLADFSPGNGTLNNALFDTNPNVSSYMFNLIAVAPFGHAQTFDPYISGGIGAVTLHATIFASNPIINPLIANNINLATEDVSGSRFGWDLGGGVMAWSPKNWGFRGDLRYYRTSSNTNDVFDINNIGDGSVFSRVELSGLSFWKANAGIAFRW